jgi:Tfp pilus assembly protein PilX
VRRLRGDRGSIPVAMMVVLVGMSLRAVMMTMVLGQLKNSAYEGRRVLALHAAQAGLDAALDQVRLSAADSSGLSYKENLPCATLTGSVGAGNAATYTVSTAYYDSDPQGNLQNTSWMTSHGIQCAPGLGARSLPRYAVFTSTGTAARGGTSSRTLRGTYVIHTSNANISGGLVHVYRPDTTYNDLCMDAGAADPAAGAQATVKTCNAGDVKQTWAYASTLQLQLVSSQTPTHPNGMCLDAGTPHAANANVLMQPCATATPGL